MRYPLLNVAALVAFAALLTMSRAQQMNISPAADGATDYTYLEETKQRRESDKTIDDDDGDIDIRKGLRKKSELSTTMAPEVSSLHGHHVKLVAKREGYWPTANYTLLEEADEGGGDVEAEGNCTRPRQPLPRYNTSCEFVQAECGRNIELFDYLGLVLCSLAKAQPLGYIVLALWLIYLISLLATTVELFFVPPLNLLSEKLHLSPGVAGVTIMALGNGAPDIFVVYSGLSQDDLALVLGTLTGGAIFITTVVLGTVMMVSKVWPCRIDKIDFTRDIIVFAIVVATIIGVAFDGVVYLVEACLFPLIYVFYIATVVGLGYFRAWIGRRSERDAPPCNQSHTESYKVTLLDDEKESLKQSCTLENLDNINPTASLRDDRLESDSRTDPLDSDPRVVSGSVETLENSLSVSGVKESLQKCPHSETSFIVSAEKGPLTSSKLQNSLTVSLSNKRPGSKSETSISENQPLTAEGQDNKLIVFLPGLSWPKRSHFLVKIIWLVQWPFSLLRWLTIPSFYHDGHWSVWHYLQTSFSPLPISLLLLIAVKGWKGFNITVGYLSLPILLVILASLPCLLLFLSLRYRRPPHWAMQFLLVPSAFFMAIIWLNLMASEIVSIMRAFGLLLTIDTAILGLTVLALGNCMADWVADTLVTRAGKPEMAFASCFGSPLLSHVLGLSIAMIVKIGLYNHGEPYRFQVHSMAYSQVKLSWIFLGVSLVTNIIVFPIFKFSPPRLYGFVLMALYVIFVVVAVLGETGVLPFNF